MKLKRTLICLLALLLALSAAACSGGGTAGDTESTAAPSTQTAPVGQATETEPAETSRAEAKDGLPADLDLDGETVRFIIIYESAQQDALGESGGDPVNDAVYNRKIAVEDRLNARLAFFVYGSGIEHDAMAQQIANNVRGGDDEYNAVMERGPQAFTLSLQGIFRDLNNNAYVDTSRPWWYGDAIENISINTDHLYLLAGDITLTPFLFSTACFFNKTMLEDYPALSADTLYQTVLDGKWTYDVWREYCTAVYVDVNGDGKADDGDRFGFSCLTPQYLTWSAGLKYIDRDEEGYPVLALNTEKNASYIVALNKMFGDSRCTYNYSDNYTTYVRHFTGGRNLFFMGRFIWVTNMYPTNLQDMNDPYGIIPYPKFAEEDPYMAGLCSSGNHVAVPTTCENFDAACAVIEAMCSESYRTVFPVLYDKALKARYSDARIDAQMIDLIHDSIYYDITQMASLDILMNELAASGNDNFASAYEAKHEAIQKSLDDLIEKYRSLGT